MAIVHGLEGSSSSPYVVENSGRALTAGCKRRASQLAGQLENQIASHGIADQRETTDEVRAGQFGHQNSDVLGAAGVIDGGGQLFASTTAAHFHADDIVTATLAAR